MILSAARTPIGRLQGALSSVPAAELAAAAVRAAVERAALPDLSEIDEVLIGNVVSAGLGQNIARQASTPNGSSDSHQRSIRLLRPSDIMMPSAGESKDASRACQPIYLGYLADQAISRRKLL